MQHSAGGTHSLTHSQARKNGETARATLALTFVDLRNLGEQQGRERDRVSECFDTALLDDGCHLRRSTERSEGGSGRLPTMAMKKPTQPHIPSAPIAITPCPWISQSSVVRRNTLVHYTCHHGTQRMKCWDTTITA